MKLLKQIIAAPFLYPGVLLVVIALLILGGRKRTTHILQGFDLVLREINLIYKKDNNG